MRFMLCILVRKHREERRPEKCTRTGSRRALSGRLEKIAPKKEPFKFEEIKNACDSKNRNRNLDVV